MQVPQTDIRIASIQQRLEGPAKAVDPTIITTILQMLIPMLIECFNPSDGTEAILYVNNRYTPADSNNSYGGYDKRLAKSAARTAKKAARKEKTKLAWEQAYELGVKTLDEIREGDPQQTNLVIEEQEDFMLI